MLAQNLHGWPRSPHYQYPWTPSWMNTPHPPTPSWTRSFCQTFQMCLWHLLHGISWPHHWQWTSQNGSSQTICHWHMETSHLHQRSLFLPWLCKFLLKVHPWLLQHHHPPYIPYQKGPTLDLRNSPTMHLRPPLSNLFLCSCSLHPKHLSPLFHHDWCFPPHRGCYSHAKDVNDDLYPCAYFSKMFSLAEWNYNIYDCKLLAVILALSQWKHYLQGTSFPVFIITDHKNLSYIKDPRKLSCHQARWALFLQDFHIEWVVTLGSHMGPTNTLSHKDVQDTSLDNADTSIVPNLVIINALNLELSSAIAKSTPFNPFVLHILSALKKGSLLFSHSSLSDWSFDNGHLYFKDCMFIPPSSCLALLHTIHSSPLSGHMGVFHTKAILERDYWWPSLSFFVKYFVDGCTICQQNKVNTHPTSPPLHPIPSSTSLPFHQLLVDLITDLPPSSGFDSVLVMVDHGLIKGVILIPCTKTIDAAGIAQLFFENVFKHFGLHDTLISDWGPQFTSAFARELTWLLKYDIQLSTAYHSQTNGQTEWTNRELETYLHIFCTNNPSSWVEFLSSAEFHHNSTPHSSTKKSPFSLLYDFELWFYPSLGKIFLPALEDCLSSLDEVQWEALAAHDSTWNLMIQWSSQWFTPWKVGNKVWLEATNLCLHLPSRKLFLKWFGPFKITHVLSPLTYCLKLLHTWKIHDVFHASLLSPYCSTKAYGPSFSEPSPDIIDNKEEYKVQTILSHKGPKSCRRYLTSWKGYSAMENIWESKSNLHHSALILSAYKQCHNL